MATTKTPMTPGAQRALNVGSSFFTDTYSNLSDEERQMVESLPGLQSDEELAAEKTAAEGKVAESRGKLAQADVAGTETVARTERQQMVEQIVQGLGKVLGGVLGEKEGFTADIKTSPSDFGAILAGRMKDIENKRRTAEGELQTAEQGLRERLQRAERVKDMRNMSAVELAQAKAQAGLRLYMEDLQNKQRDKERAEKLAAEEKEAALGSVTALTQGISREAGDIEDIKKSIRNDIGSLASDKETERKQAAARLASTLGEDPSAFQTADPATIQARAADFVAKKEERMKALSTLADKVALKTASKKKFSNEEERTITAVREQLQPSNDLEVGQINPVPITSFTEFAKAIKDNEVLEPKLDEFLRKKAKFSFLPDDPAIDIIQEKILDPKKGFKSLTMQEIAELSAYKTSAKEVDPTTGKEIVKERGLLQEFFNSPVSEGSKATMGQFYDRILKTAIEENNLSRLKLFAPNSEIGVKGFGK